MFWGTRSKDWGFSESFVLPLPLTLQVWCIGRANMSVALWGVVRAHQEMPPVCVEPCWWWARSQLGQAGIEGIAAPRAPPPELGRSGVGGFLQVAGRDLLHRPSLFWSPVPYPENSWLLQEFQNYAGSSVLFPFDREFSRSSSIGPKIHLNIGKELITTPLYHIAWGGILFFSQLRNRMSAEAGLIPEISHWRHRVIFFKDKILSCEDILMPLLTCFFWKLIQSWTLLWEEECLLKIKGREELRHERNLS